jgi:hypothetical protein
LPTSSVVTTKTTTGPAFSLSNLKVSPAEVRPGDMVSVTATITNTGEKESTFTVYLNVNGEVVDSKVVTLPGGVSDSITFTMLAEKAGDYSIEVGGATGNFNVIQPGLLWLWLTLGIAMPAVMLVVAFVTYRIRNREE